MKKDFFDKHIKIIGIGDNTPTNRKNLKKVTNTIGKHLVNSSHVSHKK